MKSSKKIPDIVEFTEEVFGIKLLEFQKEYLRRMIESPDMKIVLVPRRGGYSTKMLLFPIIKALYQDEIKQWKEKHDEY